MLPVVRSALGVVLLLFILSLNGVDSHAALSRSDPPAGAALADSPAEIRLWFTEPLEPSYTGAELLNGQGERVPSVSFSIAADDDH